MSMNISDADTRGANKNRFHAGIHPCKLVNLRQWVDQQYGQAFAVDLETISGPHGAGYACSIAIFPDSAKGGGRMTPVMAKAKEKGKIVKIVAAAYGYPNHEAEKVSQTAFDGAVMKAGPDGKFPTTPLSGRPILVKGISRPAGNAAPADVDPRTAYYCEVHPDESVMAITGAPAAAPIPAPVSIPTPVAPPAPRPFPPLGWTQHPTNPAYYYLGQECITADELRARG